MKQEGSFPSSITLNGADFFLLQFDRIMWKLSGQRNVCTFAVTLQERLEYEDLEKYLSANSAYQWVCRLRLQQGLPFTLAKWVFKASQALPEIEQYQLDEQGGLPESLLKKPFNIEQQSAFKVSLVQVSGAGSQLIFSWHHALMDAHGGETFIRHLGGSEAMQDVEWITSEQGSLLPLRERADIALKMKEFLCDVSRLPFISFTNKSKTKQAVHYRVLSFTQAQSELITERARKQGAGFLVSAFYLAATACAVANVQSKKSPLDSDMLIPIPLDHRKRGVHSPILGNQVTFLFYRVPLAALANVKTCVAELIAQMKSLMRSENPSHYLVMMDFLRRVPGWLYRMQLTSPTKGQMASFYYSDTGDSLDLYEQLFGCAVTGALHYPPNMYPPGVTFVFSRFHGALQLTMGYMDSALDQGEVEQLLAQLQFGLLGETNE